MGDGYYYEPTRPKEPKKSKAIEELEKIFEEALKDTRKEEK